MKSEKSVAVVFGTRPEAIKMAPVIKALQRTPGVRPILISTGQHRQMMAPILDFFEIKLDYDLDLMTERQTLNSLFSNALSGLGNVFADSELRRVLVQGDTTTAAAAALAAFHLGIPVGHVEAGLRTNDLKEPWPEEMNRRLIDMVSDQLYAPTDRSAQHLRLENIDDRRIFVTGNTVIDALFAALGRIEGPLAAKYAAQFSFIPRDKRLVLVTGHRRESFGEGFEQICKALKLIAERDDVHVLYPLHMNPNVREPVNRMLGRDPRISLIEPVGYPEFIYLMKRAVLILTDSGGVQEEAPSLGKQVLVMRNVTERPEAVETGCVEVVGVVGDDIFARATHHLNDPGLGKSRQIKSPYGDGRAAERIAQEVLR